VSTVAVTNDGATLISGGCDGQVIYHAFYRKPFNADQCRKL
jgi:hypothetical protein